MVSGLTISIFWSINPSFIHVLAGTALAWSGYLKAHKLVTGRFIDTSARNREVNKHFSWLGLFGIILMFSAFPSGVVAVYKESIILLLGVNTVFMGGYIIGHYGFTDELL